MNTIWEWFEQLDTAGLLRLLESAEFFRPESYNSVFQKGLEELLNRITDEGARQQILALQGFDWAAYILNSLKRAGIKDDDAQQEAFHEIAVKLLVSPGKLFHWNPAEHGPLALRFKAAVWNSIRNLISKRRNRRKWMQTADPVAMAERHPSKEADSTVIDVFRRLVRQRLGELALQILDQRLSGKETKKLVGIGTTSAFYVKRAVGEIKDLAGRFATKIGDSNFADMVSRAMAAESETIEKRKRSLAARQLSVQ